MYICESGSGLQWETSAENFVGGGVGVTPKPLLSNNVNSLLKCFWKKLILVCYST